MSISSQITDVLKRAKEPLARLEIFEAAGITDTEMSLNAFRLMCENNKVEHIGKGRGTKYKLVVEKQRKPKKEGPDHSKEVMAFANAHLAFTFKELTDAFSDDVFEHHVRASLNLLIEKEQIYILGEKRDRHYSTKPEMADALLVANENEKYEQTVSVIWPYFEKQRKGILMTDLCEKYPNIPRHILYQTLRYLVDLEKIEKFGERRGTSYSITGEGEIDKEEVIDLLKPRIMELMGTLKAARPLLLQQKLEVERILLNNSIDKLIAEKKLKENGERRAKIITLPGTSEVEIEAARQDQQNLTLIVDKFSGMLASVSISVGQRFADSPYELRTWSVDTFRKTVIDTFYSYDHVQQWIMEGIKADVQELDEVNREVSHDARRGRRKSA